MDAFEVLATAAAVAATAELAGCCGMARGGWALPCVAMVIVRPVGRLGVVGGTLWLESRGRLL